MRDAINKMPLLLTFDVNCKIVVSHYCNKSHYYDEHRKVGGAKWGECLANQLKWLFNWSLYKECQMQSPTISIFLFSAFFSFQFLHPGILLF